MKIKFLRESRVQFEGANSFGEGREIDLPQGIALAEIRAKNAIEVKPEPKKAEPKKEAKQHKEKRQDKQLKTSDKEDK